MRHDLIRKVFEHEILERLIQTSRLKDQWLLVIVSINVPVLSSGCIIKIFQYCEKVPRNASQWWSAQSRQKGGPTPHQYLTKMSVTDVVKFFTII